VLDAVYNDWIGMLPLYKAHVRALDARGLSEDQILANGYRTYRYEGRPKIASRLLDLWGQAVFMVPGIVHKTSARGSYLTLGGYAGLLVPCRNALGQIVALKVRQDEGEPRYSYISSARWGGPKPCIIPHHPLGNPASGIVRFTEGELKADASLALSGERTVAATSVSSWEPLLRVLNVELAVIAFDMDDNPMAQKTGWLTRTCLVREFRNRGVPVILEYWSGAKGIDDLFLAGKSPEMVWGNRIDEYLEQHKPSDF
jgi:hypothetical protein